MRRTAERPGAFATPRTASSWAMRRAPHLGYVSRSRQTASSTSTGTGDGDVCGRRERSSGRSVRPRGTVAATCAGIGATVPAGDLGHRRPVQHLRHRAEPMLHRPVLLPCGGLGCFDHAHGNETPVKNVTGPSKISCDRQPCPTTSTSSKSWDCTRRKTPGTEIESPESSLWTRLHARVRAWFRDTASPPRFAESDRADSESGPSHCCGYVDAAEEGRHA